MAGIAQDHGGLVEATVTAPQQDVAGFAGTRIAQSRFQGGLLRVAYVRSGRQRRVLALYWTSKTAKYWSNER